MNNKIILPALFFALSLCLHVLSSYGGMDIQKDCQINAGPCVREIEREGTEVVFDIQPKPVPLMKELLFTATLAEKGAPVTDASVILDLTMPGMYMGINRAVLTHTGHGKYEGKGIIPLCPHGGKTWRAEVKIERQDRTSSVSFTFEVE